MIEILWLETLTLGVHVPQRIVDFVKPLLKQLPRQIIGGRFDLLFAIELVAAQRIAPHLIDLQSRLGRFPLQIGDARAGNRECRIGFRFCHVFS